MQKIGRNEPCPCGSGKKYKKCHYLIKDGKEKNKVKELAEINLLRLERAINSLKEK